MSLYLASHRTGIPLDDDRLTENLLVDVSQSLQRKSVMWDKIATQTTSSRRYSYSHDRVLLSCDILGCLGWPQMMLKDVRSESARFSLVGEAIAAPTMAVAINSLFTVINAEGLFNIPFNKFLHNTRQTRAAMLPRGSGHSRFNPSLESELDCPLREAKRSKVDAT